MKCRICFISTNLNLRIGLFLYKKLVLFELREIEEREPGDAFRQDHRGRFFYIYYNSVHCEEENINECSNFDQNSHKTTFSFSNIKGYHSSIKTFIQTYKPRKRNTGKKGSKISTFK